MSRPVRVPGRNQPGQFMATRVRVLAAEVSDPQRLARGRLCAETGAVADIEVAAGLATATVQGSRPSPYIVELHVEPGDGPPSRRQVGASCSCPDDPDATEGWCKHAVATLIVLANEIAVVPDTLARWRSLTPGVTVDGADDRRSQPPPGAPGDPLTVALQVPRDVTMPVIPDVEPMVPGAVTDPDVAAVLRSAYELICGVPPPPSGPQRDLHPVPRT